jgi:hypothetical protein
MQRVLIRTSDPDSADALADALGKTDCVTERIDAKTLSVAPSSSNQIDDGQLLVELRFFVEAWRLKHGSARVALDLAA